MMRGKEYINHKNQLTIIIDGDGDNYESFEKSVDFVRANFSIEEKEYYSGFFDDALFHFDYQGSFIKLIFSGFMGTEIHISENESKEHKVEFKKLSKRIIEFIASPPTGTNRTKKT